MLLDMLLQLPPHLTPPSSRCEALFESLPESAISIASGPSDSWECLGVGVTLFETDNPFWWTRAHPQDDEARARAIAEKVDNKKQTRGGKGEIEGERRAAIVRNRNALGGFGGGDEDGSLGGYTDLEVLEVLDPPRAERIRCRQARCVSKKRKIMVR